MSTQPGAPAQFGVEPMKKKKIGVLIVAYNAVTTLNQVLDRIPPDLKEKIDEVFVFDDASTGISR